MNRTGLVRAAIGAAGLLLAPPLLFVQGLRDVCPVVLYHRVSPVLDPSYGPLPPAVFEQHCALLARQFRVLPLLELVARTMAGRSTRGCCAISFDDGYLDFREHALPILQRHALPVTHFLVADCVEGGLPPWTYRLNRLAVAKRWAREHVRTSHRLVGSMAAAERARWLECEEAQLVDAPGLPRMLRSEDVEALRDPLLEWGSHTASHGFLDRLSDEEIEREVAGSKGRLERITGHPIRLLAYPNGHHGERARRAVEHASYEAALTVNEAFLRPDSPRFAVPRFDVGGHPTRMMRVEVTGLLGALRRLRSS